MQGWPALQKAEPWLLPKRHEGTDFSEERNAFCHPAWSWAFAIGPPLLHRVLPKRLCSLLLLLTCSEGVRAAAGPGASERAAPGCEEGSENLIRGTCESANCFLRGPWKKAPRALLHRKGSTARRPLAGKQDRRPQGAIAAANPPEWAESLLLCHVFVSQAARSFCLLQVTPAHHWDCHWVCTGAWELPSAGDFG